MATNREAYDAIAPTWYGVRHWPLLRHDLERAARRWSGGHLVNLGCGAGADFLPFSQGFRLTGVDISWEMLRQCIRHARRHGFAPALLQGDVTQLPLAPATADYAIAIACYHHLLTRDERKNGFTELWRILRPGGEAFISVWNHDQPRFRAMPQDVSVPFRSGAVTVQRRYHLFKREELACALTDCGFVLLRLGYGASRNDPTREDNRNLCALVSRPEAPTT